ncbi:uncharacterized protein LOC111373765 [Olea europaea var. sylvestris]|uniref:uncharacterized protein LOC111373765 n=1 Tax=Olea europaea var. sylvestris TaxID=158386 RepID=UPI000C1D33D3|nr:uncharacterized protein LOC111373765 [Olea europaea var. sylvestris]
MLYPSEVEHMVHYLEATPSRSYKRRSYKRVPNYEDLEKSSSPPLPFLQQAPILDLKPLPPHLRYAYLGELYTLLIIIDNSLSELEEEKLLRVLMEHKKAIGWTIVDIREISPSLCMHKILMEDDFKPSSEHQRWLNPNMKEVVGVEVVKWLDASIIYLISDSAWDDELIPTGPVTGWRVCIDYFSGVFSLLLLDGYSGYNQIPIAPEDQEKTIFTCSYGTFVYRRMPFGLSDAPTSFRRYMMAIFSDMVEKCIEISCKGIEVDKVKIQVIEKLPPPTSVKGIRSFWVMSNLIRGLSRTSRRSQSHFAPYLRRILHLISLKECLHAFNTLKEKLITTYIIVASDWNLPFELMYDSRDYAVGAVFGQRRDKILHVTYYAR